MPTWLVSGSGGMLGRDLVATLTAAGEHVVGLDRAALDIGDPDAVRAAVQTTRPAVVVNCAAWTAVDDAETREADALLVNGTGAANVANACAEAGAVLIQVSTNYVFDGEATDPYDEDAATAPQTVYGRTKLAGDVAVLAALPESGYVVRTAWLYGVTGQSFVRTMLSLEASRPTVDVVNDQYGQPTWTVDLAAGLVELGRAALAGTAPAGVYHGVSSGEATWFDLARETFRLADADPERVRPTTSAAFVRPAARPANGVLGVSRWQAAGLTPLPDWRESLAVAVPLFRSQ